MEEEFGLWFRLTDGGLAWEATPGIEHQRLIYPIQRSKGRGLSVKPECGCRQFADVDIAFFDGAVKRPDISNWCAWPKESEGFVHEISEAVVEVLNVESGI